MTSTGLGVDAYYIDTDYTAQPIQSFGYALTLPEANVTTLSSNTDGLQESFVTQLQGLLYVPTLSDETCTNISAAYVPSNATTESDLPGGATLPRIAIAPWTTTECVQAYLSMGRADLVNSFVFFLPGQGSAQPPVASSQAWSLNDTGQWKSDNGYPVYALSSTTGEQLMQELGLYSGNLSTTPYADKLGLINKGGSVRLGITIDIAASRALPSLWIFLIIILAILVVLVAVISFIMNLVQRRRAARLRRRIENGEVDLESLGIKRLKIPADMLEKMPTYTYAGTGTAVVPEGQIKDPEEHPLKSPVAPHVAIKAIQTGNHFEQPTCAICLDDFEAGQSQVRELPCNHIFHPECIDTFLTQISSLCPLCKATAMPAGWSPKHISPAMVRRERLLRKERRQAARRGSSGANAQTGGGINLTAIIRRPSGAVPSDHRPPVAPSIGQPIPQTEGDDEPAPTTLPAQSQDRQAWIQRRIDAIADDSGLAVHDPDRDESRRPFIVRAWRTAFPRG